MPPVTDPTWGGLRRRRQQLGDTGTNTQPPISPAEQQLKNDDESWDSRSTLCDDDLSHRSGIDHGPHTNAGNEQLPAERLPGSGFPRTAEELFRGQPIDERPTAYSQRRLDRFHGLAVEDSDDCWDSDSDTGDEVREQLELRRIEYERRRIYDIAVHSILVLCALGVILFDAYLWAPTCSPPTWRVVVEVRAQVQVAGGWKSMAGIQGQLLRAARLSRGNWTIHPC
jgi:hypothetical protein